MRRCVFILARLWLVGLALVATGSANEPLATSWQPFAPVRRPLVPPLEGESITATAIDAFLAQAQQARDLTFRPEAPKEILLRRVYLDLIGLAPTPDQRAAFLADAAPDAYPKVVDRLLADPRHAERWARHWMDIWRYSDWAGWNDGKQIRDSQPHIWRWRDWIIESLAADVGYDRMITDMLAADERAPEDTSALRATGFLARNYKMLSREQWLEDTVKHISLAFFGLTMGCAKCHDHMTDPIAQTDYYALRAVFEPHKVRLDHVPGQPDPSKDGLARVFDADLTAATYLFPRGDERNPDKSRPIAPGVPGFLGGSLAATPIALPFAAIAPQRREFVRHDLQTAAEQGLRAAKERALLVEVATLRALGAVFNVERLEDAGKKNTPEWEEAARLTLAAQRDENRERALWGVVVATIARANSALSDAGRAETIAKNRADAVKRLDDARKSFDLAKAACTEPLTTAFTPRPMPVHPIQSSGRRLAFARWLTRPEHPLTARVAVNHVWARHFGVGIVPTVADFGRGGQKPSHPELLDWLAAEFMDHGSSFKHLHRLICLSQAYRQDSRPGAGAPSLRDGGTGDSPVSLSGGPPLDSQAPMAPGTHRSAADATPNDTADAPLAFNPQPEIPNPKSADPDNTTLWHFPSRRLEAEAVRDNILFLTGGLDLTFGGPEIDQAHALTSPRRSLYLRCAAEKQPEFLQVFDGPSVVECYERKPTVMPQQALALLNSELTVNRARSAAAQSAGESDDAAVVRGAFIRFLTREPQPQEVSVCLEFLRSGGPRTREMFFLTLLNHHEFLTLR
ncbi:MAG: DUF1549 and DUF1553 domain-containing protein [Verrucomicrobiales bacterium]